LRDFIVKDLGNPFITQKDNEKSIVFSSGNVEPGELICFDFSTLKDNPLHDYSLNLRLGSIKFVFLYRFIMEISTWFEKFQEGLQMDVSFYLLHYNK
jgi:hypothetical protein